MSSKLVHVCNQPIYSIINIKYLVCEALKIGDNNILECKGIQRFSFD